MAGKTRKGVENYAKDTLDGIGKEAKEAAQASYQRWADKTNSERLESIATYQAMIINKVLKDAKATNDRSGVFWEKKASQAELDASIPFNGATGKPYTNLDNILMRSVMAIEGFKEPIFMTMREANIMGGTLKKTGEQTRNGKDEYVKGIKVVQLKQREFVPELDKNGKKILEPAFDKDGNAIMTKNGEQAQNVKGKWVELKEAVFESITLYNVAQFDNINRDKLAKLDMTSLQQKRAELRREFRGEEKFATKYKSLEGKTGTNTLRNLREFTKATQTGKEFTPSLSVNMSAKKEIVQEKQQQQGFSR